MKILMVCLGNICRSPMAEGIMSELVRMKDLDWHIDSAGTGSWHEGESPDRRAIATCDKFGIDIRHQRARQIQLRDLDDFDLILTMDRTNYSDVMRLADSPTQEEKIQLITAFGDSGYEDVPDPYFDGSFERVYTLLRTICGQVLEDIHDEHMS